MNYAPDDPAATHPFSEKLANEQNFTWAYTQRAIEEYKKFIYLCCISPHGASPPPVVDEVWHLHLTYTLEYWQRFCKEILERELHHQPSRGGPGEKEKHDQWYADTLLLYESTFGHPPPPDIWPPPGEPHDLSNIRWSAFRDRTFPIRCILPFIPSFYTLFFFGTAIPFHLNGPQFLQFYILAIICIIPMAWWARELKQNKLHDLLRPAFLRMSRYELAYLTAKAKGYSLLCLTELIDKAYLVRSDSEHYTVTKEASTYSDCPILPLLDDGAVVDLRQLHTMTQPESHNLVKKHGPLTDAWNRTALHYTLPILLLLVLGIARVVQGIYNDRPVFYLISLILLTALVLTPRKNDLQSAFEAIFSRDTSGITHIKDKTSFDFITMGIWGVSNMLLGTDLGKQYADLTGQKLYERGEWIGGSNGNNSCGSSCGGGGGCGGGGCGGCGG